MFGLAVCHRRHSKMLTLQARELAAGAHVMFGMRPMPQADHVLLYPVEASAQLHTMFSNGSLQLVQASGAVGRCRVAVRLPMTRWSV
jgi:hypothetical protein